MNYENKKIIVSVSGGKDSTAMCLNLLEQGYSTSDFERVFMDTGWEDAGTYQYLDELEKTIGPIIRLKADIQVKEEYKEYVEYFETKLGWESQFIRRLFKYQFPPTRRMKWCTTELKIKPVKEYFDSLEDDFVNLVGIRKEESARRSKMIEWEFNEYLDCWVHRPLIDWKEEDVISIHQRFGIAPNRLYLNGSYRVGCYPCINSRKEEIKLLPNKRIEIIRELEDILTKLRKKRTGKDLPITFFSSKSIEPMFIDQVMEWSRTTRGGVQLELFSTEEPTCVKWGMCEHK